MAQKTDPECLIRNNINTEAFDAFFENQGRSIQCSWKKSREFDRQDWKLTLDLGDL